MKLVLISFLFVTACSYAASNEASQAKNAVTQVHPDFDFDRAMQVLRFCQQAKATQSYPDVFTPGKVSGFLEVVRLKDPSLFEQVYGELTEQVLLWSKQHLLPEKE